MRGRWQTEIPGYDRLFIELGCGKGRFTYQTAGVETDALIVAVEKIPDAMVIAMERVVNEELENVRFTVKDAANLPEYFAESEADRIYINFCDPWPNKKHWKRRLTAPSFLAMYRSILKDGGEIHFKTDNRDLFDWSLEQFEGAGWDLSEVTHDLHADGINGIMTDYEAKFYEQGIKINRCVAAVKKG
jgi:tRNA (guanine-N7-)-methyltransferase